MASQRSSFSPRDSGIRRTTGLLAARFLFSLAVSAVLWTATASAAPPTVIHSGFLTSPGANVHVAFSQAMDAATLVTGNISVYGTSSGNKTCSFSYDSNCHELLISPSTAFQNAEQVSVTVGTGVRDSTGTAMSNQYLLSFRTENALGAAKYWASAVSGNWSDASKWSPSGAPAAGERVVVNASGAAYTVTLDVSPTIGSLDLTSASATVDLGSASVTADSVSYLSAGIIRSSGAGFSGRGSLVFNGAVTMYGSLSSALPVALTPAGNLTLKGESDLHARLYPTESLRNAGVIVLDAYGGSLQGHAEIISSTGTIVNTGSLCVVSSPYCYIKADLDNRGTVSVDQNLTLANSGRSYRNRGSLSIASGRTLLVNGGGQALRLISGAVTAVGNLSLENCSFFAEGGTLSGTASLSACAFSMDSAFPALSLLCSRGCTLSGNIASGANIRVVGASATHSYISSASSFTNFGSVTLQSYDGTNDGEARITIASGNLTNAGNIEITGAPFGRIEASFVNNGRLHIGQDFTMINQSASYQNSGFISVASGRQWYINAYGQSFAMSGGNLDISGTFTLKSAPCTVSGGNVVLNGTLTAGSGFNLSGGTLSGTGTVDSVVTSSGNIVPGPGPGTLRITGAYIQQTGGNLQLEVNGPAAGTETDMLSVQGWVELNGNLDLNLDPSYGPGPGTNLIVLGHTARTGGFSSLTGNEATLIFSTYYGDAGVFIRATTPVSYSGGNIIESEPNGTRGEANLLLLRTDSRISTLKRSVASGNLGLSGDTTDVYVFYGYAGDRISATVHTTSGSLSTRLTLFERSSGGWTFLASDSSGGPGTNPRIGDALLPDTSMYYLSVDRQTNDGFYGIELLVNRDGRMETDEDDANGSVAGADFVPLKAGASQTAFILTTMAGVLDAGENDFFALHLFEGDAVSLTVSGNSGTLKPALSLLDGGGNTLSQDANSGNTQSAAIASYQAPSDGLYYARVTAASGGGYEAFYALSGNATGRARGLDAEPNDSSASAGQIALTSASGEPGLLYGLAVGDAGSTSGSSADWFSFSAQAGDRVSVTMHTLSGTLLPRLTLLNGSAAAVEEDLSHGPGVNARIYDAAISSSGAQYLKCESASGGGIYLVELEIVRPGRLETDEDDSNASLAGADPLFFYSSDAGRVRITTMAGTADAGDRDLFAVFLYQGEQLSLSVSGNAGTLVPGVLLRGPSGSLITGSTGTTALHSAGITDCTIPSDGLHYAEITASTGAGYRGFWWMSGSIGQRAPDRFESEPANDAWTGARTITLSANADNASMLTGTASGNLGLDGGDAADWYGFSLQSGDRVSITMHTLLGPLQPKLGFYSDPAAAAVENDYQDGPGVNARIYDRQVSSTGTHYVKCEAAGYDGLYQVEVQVNRAGRLETDENGANDSITGADWLTLSTGSGRLLVTTTAGVLDSGGDRDFFGLYLFQGDRLSLAASGNAGTLAPTLSLRDASGTLLTSNSGTSSARSASISGYQAASDGFYYAEISESTGAGFGAFWWMSGEITGRLAGSDLEPSNNVYTGASPITMAACGGNGSILSGRAAGDIGMGYDSSADWYSFSAQSGDRVSLTMHTISGNLYPKIGLYASPSGNADEEDLSHGPGTNSRIFDRLITSSGNQYIKCEASGLEGFYLVELLLNRGGRIETDEDDANGAASAADPISLSTSAGGGLNLVSMAGTLDVGEKDWFVLQLAATMTLSLSANSCLGTMSPSLRLWNSDATQLLGSDANSGNAQLASVSGYAVASGGNYLLEVGANQGAGYTAAYFISGNVSVSGAQPVALAAFASTNQDTALSLTLRGLGATAGSGNLSYAVLASPSHGALSGSAPSLVYTPTGGFYGSDMFTFTVTESGVTSAAAAVILDVLPANRAPSASGANLSATENTALSLTLSASDADGDTLSYAIVSQPSLGTLSGNAPSLTYTPLYGRTGQDSFTFKANDGKTDSPPAVARVSIANANDAPRAGTARAFGFDGSSAWMEAQPASTLRPASALSLEFWMKANSFSSGAGPAAYAWDNGADEAGYGFSYVGGRLRFRVKTASMAADAWDSLPGESLPAGRWLHVAGTYDGSAVKLYVNGELRGSAAASGALNWSPSPYALYLGRFRDSDETFYFDGSLDDLRLWSTSRSQAELQASMNATLSGNESGLSGWWRSMAGSGNTASDGSGNGNNASQNNMTGYSWYDAISADGADAVAGLSASDPDGDALSYTITALPSSGNLYAYSGGARGGRIASAPASLSANAVIYVPAQGFAGEDFFSYTASDGALTSQNTARGRILATRTNRTPSISWLASDISTYVENGSGTALDAGGDAAVSDPDSADFAGGYVLVAWQSGAESDDRIFLGTDFGISLSGTSVLLGGTQLGTLDSALDGVGTRSLKINLLSAATPSFTGNVLRSLYYRSLSENPSQTVRSILVTVDDGDGGSGSASAAVSLAVQSVNDAPVASAAAYTVWANGGTAITLSASDLDHASHSYTVATQPARGSLSGTPPSLYYTAQARFVGSDSFTFTADDGIVSSQAATVSVIITDTPPSISFTSPASASVIPALLSSIDLAFDQELISGTTPGCANNAASYYFLGSGKGGASVSSVSGSGNSYRLAISGAFSEGTLILAVSGVNNLNGMTIASGNTAAMTVDGSMPALSDIRPSAGTVVPETQQARLVFSEAVAEYGSYGARNTANYSVSCADNSVEVSSVVGSGAGPYLLSFNKALPDGAMSLTVKNLRDLNGNPMSATQVTWIVDAVAPSLLSASPAVGSVLRADSTLRLVFSEDLYGTSGGQPAITNFVLEGSASAMVELASVSHPIPGAYDLALRLRTGTVGVFNIKASGLQDRVGHGLTLSGVGYVVHQASPMSLRWRPTVSVGTKSLVSVAGGAGALRLFASPPGLVEVAGFELTGLKEGIVTLLIRDESGQELSTTMAVLPADARTVFLEMPRYSSQKDFRMVSFPFSLYKEAELKSVFEERLGKMSEETWIIYRLNPAGGGSYLPLGSSGQPVGPGCGFWMACLRSVELPLDLPGPVEDEPVSLGLGQGWNLLGNPYRKTLDVAKVFVSTDGGFVSIKSAQSAASRHLWYIGDGYKEYHSMSTLPVMASAWLYVFPREGVTIRFGALDYGLARTQSGPDISKAGEEGTPRSELALEDGEPEPPSPPGSGGSLSGSASSGRLPSGGGGGGCLLTR